MFVGTKKQAVENVTQAAQRVGMPYVTFRWLGGQLTNWDTMRQRVSYLLELEGRRDRGEFAMLTKKEALLLEREIEKLNKRLGGIKTMTDLPNLLYIVDTRREEIAVKEASKLKIPIVGVVDTNCDPDPIKYVIPSNDDAIRAIKLITDRIASAVEEGLAVRDRTLVDQIMGVEEVEVDTSQRVFDPFEGDADEDRDSESEAAAEAIAQAQAVAEVEADMLARAKSDEAGTDAVPDAEAGTDAAPDAEAGTDAAPDDTVETVEDPDAEAAAPAEKDAAGADEPAAGLEPSAADDTTGSEEPVAEATTE
jgi:small subunit ribosomal protein S2